MKNEFFENEEEVMVYQKPGMKETELKLVFHGDTTPEGGTSVVDPDDDPDF